MITHQLIQEAYTYEAYLQLASKLFAEGKTTGPIQNEAMTHYTMMNLKRMSRLDKTTRLNQPLLDLLQKTPGKQIWLVLTESWCGDAAQVVPVLNKMAEASQNIELKFILRDENPEIMDAYLTNGGRSIPKLIIMDANTLEEIATWGPRPAALQEIVLQAKADKIPYEEVNKQTQLWYAKDKTQSIQEEFISLLTPKLIKTY